MPDKAEEDDFQLRIRKEAAKSPRTSHSLFDLGDSPLEIAKRLGIGPEYIPKYNPDNNVDLFDFQES